jgi:hypothetical protein
MRAWRPTRAGLLLPLRRVCSGGCLSQKDLEVKAGGAGGAGGGEADGAGGDMQRPRGLLPCPDTVECSMCLEAPENPVRTCVMWAQRGLCCESNTLPTCACSQQDDD